MIYEDPNHPLYGPVRRLHLKLMELFGSDLAEVEREFSLGLGLDWTQFVERNLGLGLSEAHTARFVLKTMLYLFDTIESRRHLASLFSARAS
jgi:hypothetical protein